MRRLSAPGGHASGPAIRWSVGSRHLETTDQGMAAREPAARVDHCRRIGTGGDEETRTPDPLLAKEMLFQLSYVPVELCDSVGPLWGLGMVGVSGLEPETSALSGQCSNQLS